MVFDDETTAFERARSAREDWSGTRRDSGAPSARFNDLALDDDATLRHALEAA